MEEMLQDLPGCICYMDDILVYGDEENHDSRLDMNDLKRIKSSGIKLNKQKCEFRKSTVKFLGHKLNKLGVHVDPERIAAIQGLLAPRTVSELRSLLGMINHLCRFLPAIQPIMKPLNDLLKNDAVWQWETAQQQALDKAKQLIQEAPVLSFFDSTAETVVATDASTYGIGGCLMQKKNDKLYPVAFCSRMLSKTEQGYAQIEKENLAAVWTCEKFHMYLYGLPKFILKIDHKPLVPLINNKSLVDAPIRCQRMLMRLRLYNPSAVFIPGKQHTIADYLSRNPTASKTDEISEALQVDVLEYVSEIIHSFPATDQRLEEMKKKQAENEEIRTVIDFTKNGWPSKGNESNEFFVDHNKLSVVNNLLLYGNRIVIPSTMRRDILRKLHDGGHFGLNKCRQRASTSAWWPGFNDDLKKYIEACQFCQTNAPRQRKEPLLPTPLPENPWSHIAADICQVGRNHYLVTVDLYSRYIEIQQLRTLTTSAVIERLKTTFAHHGIPDLFTSDGGPQFASKYFSDFAQEYGFKQHITDPYHSQSNGAAERAVRTAKWIIKQKYPHLALLNYRTTSIEATGSSPAKLLMGRELWTRIRTTQNKKHSLDTFTRQQDAMSKKRSERNYNKHHGVRKLTVLSEGDNVRMRTDTEHKWSKPGVVQKKMNNRSYTVNLDGWIYRRNRRHLLYVP
ncbi:Uncharacterised protein g6958 [Pycnogonum litorale]